MKTPDCVAPGITQSYRAPREWKNAEYNSAIPEREAPRELLDILHPRRDHLLACRLSQRGHGAIQILARPRHRNLLTQHHSRTAPDLPTLIGIEGAASAGYFQSWRQLWQPPWTFPGRNRRPPRDPVNALLSLSYTMALGYLGRLVSLHGLDPTIGFLHGPQRGRPALALDLLEILRPGLEHWVWTLLAGSGELQPTDFNDSDSEGCRLSRDGRENYYTAWFRDEEQRLRTLARAGLAGLLRGLRGERPRDWGSESVVGEH